MSDQEAQTDETDTSRENEELGSPDSIDSFLQDPSKRKLDFAACQQQLQTQQSQQQVETPQKQQQIGTQQQKIGRAHV